MICLDPDIPASMEQPSAPVSHKNCIAPPTRKEDGTATWSLTLLRRALRAAPDGLPRVSPFTIIHTLHEAGYSWQRSRSWCQTGKTLHRSKDGEVFARFDPLSQKKQAVIERAYQLAERL